jgi:hypothetical protein
MSKGTESGDPDRTQSSGLSREELFELHQHYEAAAKDERDFFFRYLHFYIGLLSALLAVTLTGLLGLFRASLDPLLEVSFLTGLLIGPILTISLSYVGFPVLEVCQRRFIEAWITTINIQEMLGLKSSIPLKDGIRPPKYEGTHANEFIAQFGPEHADSLKILKKADEHRWPSEKVLNEVLKKAGQLRMARRTFRLFKVAATLLGVVIAADVVFSIQSLSN